MTTRTTLRRDLADLKQRVYLLGEKCIEIADVYNSLFETTSQNLEKKLIDITNEIKSEYKDLHKQCFLVLTLQQPLIKDLRFVVGSLQIILNLEKISEQYNSTLPQISGITILESNLKDLFTKMAHLVQDMLRASLTLYLSSNIEITENISKLFTEVSYHHNILYKQILNEVAKTSGEKAQIEAQLLGTIRTLEKISDLTLNISDQVSYIILDKTN